VTEDLMGRLASLVVGMVGTFLTLFFTYRKNREKVEAEERRAFQSMLDARVDKMFEHFQQMLHEEQKACELKINRLQFEIDRLSNALGSYQRSTRGGE
jgi:ABC-type nickel/cobalt efflux system permease component RcnA